MSVGVQTNFRIPAELKHWLQQRAAETRRTLTAELILAIEEHKKAVERQAEGPAH